LAASKASDAARARQLILCGIPPAISKKTVKKMCVKWVKKVDDIQRLKPDTDYDGPGSALALVSPPGPVYLVVCASRKDAAKLVEKVGRIFF
jgi:hypothetical protein